MKHASLRGCRAPRDAKGVSRPSRSDSCCCIAPSDPFPRRDRLCLFFRTFNGATYAFAPHSKDLSRQSSDTWRCGARRPLDHRGTYPCGWGRTHSRSWRSGRRIQMSLPLPALQRRSDGRTGSSGLAWKNQARKQFPFLGMHHGIREAAERVAPSADGEFPHATRAPERRSQTRCTPEQWPGPFQHPLLTVPPNCERRLVPFPMPIPIPAALGAFLNPGSFPRALMRRAGSRTRPPDWPVRVSPVFVRDLFREPDIEIELKRNGNFLVEVSSQGTVFRIDPTQ